jgi:uncharacterized protein (DUF58 family)
MSRLALLALTIAGLFLLGAATLHGEIVALAVPLVVYVAAAVLFGPPEPRLAATRRLSATRASHEDLVTVTVTLVNKGAPIEEVLVVDAPPAGLHVIEGQARAAAALGTGKSLQIEYTVRCSRGVYNFGDLRATASDRSGLFHWQRAAPAPATLTVLPQSMALRSVTIRPLRTLAHAGPVPARQGGTGIEFFGVRPYHIGDPLRWVNWAKTARHPSDLFSNEFEQERIADVGLIVDARLRSNIWSHSDSLFEHSVRAAASLASAFLEAGDRVALLIYGSGIEWTFPGYGKLQRERIMQSLARAHSGERDIFEALEYVPTRLFPPHSQVVIVSPLWDDDLQTIVHLRAWGYQTLVVSPDPVAFEMAGMAGGHAAAMAGRIARIERTLLLRRLRQAGVWVVDWPVTRPLDQALAMALGRTPQWFRNVQMEAGR